MKGLVYFAVVASVQASHLGHQSLHRRATGSHNCKTYTVQDGDSCVSIGRSSGATWAQLLSWNSDINSECSYVNADSLNDEGMKLIACFLGTSVTSLARISASVIHPVTMQFLPPALRPPLVQLARKALSPPQRKLF